MATNSIRRFVVVGQQDPDLKTVGRQRRKDVVAPLDEGDAVLKEFGNGEILGIAELLDAVGVEMVDDHVALVAIGEGEGRLVTGSSTPTARAKPWVKWVLPAPRSPTSTRRSPSTTKAATSAARAWVPATSVVAQEITFEATDRAPDGRLDGDHGEHPNLIDRGLDLARRRRNEAVAVAAHVRREDRPGQPIVGTLGDNEALPGVEHGVGHDHTDHGVGAEVGPQRVDGEGQADAPSRPAGSPRRRCRRPH